MKRIITLLLIILVSNPVIGQITKQNGQEFENLQNYKIFKPSKKHQKKFKDFKFNTNKVKYNKTSTAAKKTLDSVTSQEWDKNFNQWKNDIKQEFIYDGEYVDTLFISLGDTDTNSWELVQKIGYKFDDNGNIFSLTTSYLSSPNVWVLNSKTENKYILNNAGDYKLTEEVTFTRNTSENKWVNSTMYTFTYDTSETVLALEVMSVWYADNWLNIDQDEYFYNNEKISSKISSALNYSNGLMEQKSKWDYFWDSPFVEIEYYYDADEDEWVNEYKYVYDYKTWSGSLIQVTKETGFTWDTTDWKPDYQDVYKYDDKGNRTTASYFEWQENPGVWYVYLKDEFVFDYAFDFQDDLIVPYNYADSAEETVFTFNNMIIGYLEYEYINQIWVDSYKTLFYYSEHSNPLSVEDNKLADAVRVYPNPVTDILIIDSNMPLKGVEIYSILGKKIMDVRTDFTSIPVSNFSNGIYIIKIQSDNGVLIKKIIKK